MKYVKTIFSPKEVIDYINEFNSLKKNNFIYIKGLNNVLITSVHGFPHIRKNKVKVKDSGSILFAYVLAKLTNSNFLGIMDENLIDSNYYKNTDFKKKLMKVKNGIDIILDFHSSHVYRIADIEIGTMNGKTLSDDKVLLFKKYFDLYRYLTTENEIFAGLGEDNEAETIIKFSKEILNIQAVQFEINSCLIFEETTSRIYMHNYAKLLNCFAQVIKEINE